MAGRAGGSRCVFIGNIAYDAKEPELVEIFKEVGPIVSFRMVCDRDTGKPKGYGFCEYPDESLALSALRNLNDREVCGRRLRVDFADNAQGASGGRGGMSDLPRDIAALSGAPFGISAPQPPPTATSAIPFQPGSQSNFPPGMPTTEAVAQALTSLSQGQLFEIATQMKQMAQTNPEQCRLLLSQNPQLGVAILQLLSSLGVVKVMSAGAPPTAAAAVASSAVPPQPPVQPKMEQMMPPQPIGGPIQPLPPVLPPYGAMPPQQPPAYGAPPQVPPQMMPQMGMPGGAPSAQHLILQQLEQMLNVSLPQEQLNQLLQLSPAQLEAALRQIMAETVRR